MAISTLKSKVSFACLSLLLQLSLAASVTEELKLSSKRTLLSRNFELDSLLFSRNLDGEEEEHHDGEEEVSFNL